MPDEGYRHPMTPVLADILAKLYANETGDNGGIFALPMGTLMKDFAALYTGDVPVQAPA